MVAPARGACESMPGATTFGWADGLLACSADGCAAETINMIAKSRNRVICDLLDTRMLTSGLIHSAQRRRLEPFSTGSAGRDAWICCWRIPNPGEHALHR